MKIGGNYPDSWIPARVTGSWRVEKPHASSDLRDEPRRQPARTTTIVTRNTASRLSRFETKAAADIERSVMSSAFVAQVLGQILGSEPDNRIIADRAYARTRAAVRETRLVQTL